MSNELLGGLIILSILILIELFDLIRVLIFVIMKRNSWKWFIYWIMNIFIPPLNSKRLISILMNKSSNKLCQLIENEKEILLKIGSFKEMKEDDLIKHIFIGFIQISLLMIILCLIDLKYFSRKMSLTNFENEINEDEIAEDVLNEQTRLFSSDYSMKDPFIALDIVQKYPKKDILAINHLTFSIEHGQCFALLGFNGAGNFFFFFFFY